MDDIKDWITTIESIKLPRWDDLPNIDLYVDQVIEYITEPVGLIFITSPGTFDKILTASMVNNYVKNSIMPAPIKKKYSKDHVAFIIAITVLKQVSSLASLSNGIRYITNKFGKVEAFNLLITYLENSLRAMIAEINGAPDVKYFQEPLEIDLLPLKTTTIAFASKMMSEYLLNQLKPTNGEKEKKWERLQ